MPTLVIRNVEGSLHARLKKQAAGRGRSMEEEVRRILRERLTIAPASTSADWVDAVRALFEPLGGLDLPEIEREKLPDPADRSAWRTCRSPPSRGRVTQTRLRRGARSISRAVVWRSLIPGWQGLRLRMGRNERLSLSLKHKSHRARGRGVSCFDDSGY